MLKKTAGKHFIFSYHPTAEEYVLYRNHIVINLKKTIIDIYCERWIMVEESGNHIHLAGLLKPEYRNKDDREWLSNKIQPWYPAHKCNRARNLVWDVSSSSNKTWEGCISYCMKEFIGEIKTYKDLMSLNTPKSCLNINITEEQFLKAKEFSEPFKYKKAKTLFEYAVLYEENFPWKKPDDFYWEPMEEAEDRFRKAHPMDVMPTIGIYYGGKFNEWDFKNNLRQIIAGNRIKNPKKMDIDRTLDRGAEGSV